MTSKVYYPWSSLTEVGKTFLIENEKGKQYISQLIYAVNLKQKKLESGIKYRFYRNDEGNCVVERVS